MPRLKFWSPLALSLCALQPFAHADPILARHLQGTLHAFLDLRAEDGHIIASGDVFEVAHGDRVTTQTIFHFKDGSTDDETVVYLQRRTYQLISDRRIQKGPAFPHPMDVLIDVRGGLVTVRTTDKDGKEDVKKDHITLPPDLANGLVPIALQELPAGTAQTTLSMVVMTPKPRVVKLIVSLAGEDNISVAGMPRKATRYEIKVDLGGVVGVIAPLIGKAPPNIQTWVIGGASTTFARETGPLYPEGPIVTIQLASPVWADEK